MNYDNWAPSQDAEYVAMPILFEGKAKWKEMNQTFRNISSILEEKSYVFVKLDFQGQDHLLRYARFDLMKLLSDHHTGLDDYQDPALSYTEDHGLQNVHGIGQVDYLPESCLRLETLPSVVSLFKYLSRMDCGGPIHYGYELDKETKVVSMLDVPQLVPVGQQQQYHGLPLPHGSHGISAILTLSQQMFCKERILIEQGTLVLYKQHMVPDSFFQANPPVCTRPWLGLRIAFIRRCDDKMAQVRKSLFLNGKFGLHFDKSRFCDVNKITAFCRSFVAKNKSAGKLLTGPSGNGRERCEGFPVREQFSFNGHNLLPCLPPVINEPTQNMAEWDGIQELSQSVDDLPATAGHHGGESGITTASGNEGVTTDWQPITQIDDKNGELSDNNSSSFQQKTATEGGVIQLESAHVFSATQNRVVTFVVPREDGENRSVVANECSHKHKTETKTGKLAFSGKDVQSEYCSLNPGWIADNDTVTLDRESGQEPINSSCKLDLVDKNGTCCSAKREDLATVAEEPMTLVDVTIPRSSYDPSTSTARLPSDRCQLSKDRQWRKRHHASISEEEAGDSSVPKISKSNSIPRNKTSQKGKHMHCGTRKRHVPKAGLRQDGVPEQKIASSGFRPHQSFVKTNERTTVEVTVHGEGKEKIKTTKKRQITETQEDSKPKLAKKSTCLKSKHDGGAKTKKTKIVSWGNNRNLPKNGDFVTTIISKMDVPHQPKPTTTRDDVTVTMCGSASMSPKTYKKSMIQGLKLPKNWERNDPLGLERDARSYDVEPNVEESIQVLDSLTASAFSKEDAESAGANIIAPEAEAVEPGNFQPWDGCNFMHDPGTPLQDEGKNRIIPSELTLANLLPREEAEDQVDTESKTRDVESCEQTAVLDCFQTILAESDMLDNDAKPLPQKNRKCSGESRPRDYLPAEDANQANIPSLYPVPDSNERDNFKVFKTVVKTEYAEKHNISHYVLKKVVSLTPNTVCYVRLRSERNRLYKVIGAECPQDVLYCVAFFYHILKGNKKPKKSSHEQSIFRLDNHAKERMADPVENRKIYQVIRAPRSSQDNSHFWIDPEDELEKEYLFGKVAQMSRTVEDQGKNKLYKTLCKVAPHIPTDTIENKISEFLSEIRNHFQYKELKECKIDNPIKCVQDSLEKAFVSLREFVQSGKYDFSGHQQSVENALVAMSQMSEEETWKEFFDRHGCGLISTFCFIALPDRHTFVMVLEGLTERK